MPADNRVAPESELIKAIRLSDQAAFKVLCQIYYDLLYRFLWRKTRDEETAKDLVQELFLNVWKIRANLEESQSLKAYLYRSANNLAINHLKKKALRQARLVDNAAVEQIAGTDERSDFQEYAEDALHGLPEEQRLVFMLNKFEGLKYAEIAELLQISVKTVESRMSKALKMLREKLQHLLIFIIFCHFFYFG